jgi:probable rRNA maturation factor
MTTRPRDAARLNVTVVGPVAARLASRGLGSWLCRVAPRRARGELTIALMSDARMRRLNRTFRGVDHATDVLSFSAFASAFAGAPSDSRSAPASARRSASASARRVSSTSESAPPPLGDVAIATGVAARQARAAGHTLGTELRVLALHGLLHLLGFDHETDSGRMARAEAKLRRAGRLTEGLIERGRPAIRAAKSAAATRERR